MGLMIRPEVKKISTGKTWEHEYENFFLKAYIPDNNLEGQVNNYCFKAPLLLVFEENRLNMDEAVSFAREKGFADIAGSLDAGVFFIYPKAPGGWESATVDLYKELISEVKMYPVYEDGIVEFTDFRARKYEGFFIRGAIFRADIYSYGKSADYVAGNLLRTVNGQYLWGPGEITPAMCSMERLSIIPDVKRTDMAIISVSNTEKVNEAFKGCEHLLIKESEEPLKDYKNFVWKYKRWCGVLETDPDYAELDMTAESGIVTVKTSPDNKSRYKDDPEHKVGYFAYYNNGIFDITPAPLVIGFHGGGDSSLFLTYVAGWWEVCHKYGFLFVSIDEHLSVTATEVMQILDELKKRYRIDEKRIYATGFSMGSGKTWDLYQEYPESFAGFMPCSALFDMKDNPYGLSLGDPRLNMSISRPMFYSGGEESPLPELPSQGRGCLDRIRYLAEVNRLKKTFDIDYDKKDEWEDRYYGLKGDRTELIPDESRGSILTVRYYESEDGVCRTALASVSGQEHDCRLHSVENAWKFISRFTL
ncbi:MAG: hypothetical protein K5886_10920 [Lachnospiraceae bacterium]|nr:hypothetical protein [Lachnospiraceae bacterium]